MAAALEAQDSEAGLLGRPREGLEDADKTTVKTGSALHAEEGTGRQLVGWNRGSELEDSMCAENRTRARQPGLDRVHLSPGRSESRPQVQTMDTTKACLRGWERTESKRTCKSPRYERSLERNKLTQVLVIDFIINQAKKTAKEALLLLLPHVVPSCLPRPHDSRGGGGNGDVAAHGGVGKDPQVGANPNLKPETGSNPV